MKIIKPTEARNNLYNIINEVNQTHEPVTIYGHKENSSAVLIGKEDWESIKETLFLEQTGVMDSVRKREEDDSGFTDIDDINWDNL